MSQNAGATHSPSRHSPSPPLDDHSPNDERKHCDNNSLASDNDDMEVDDMGTEWGGRQDIQSPDAGHSPSPSLDPHTASDDDDMQVDAMGIDQSGGRHTPSSAAGQTASPLLNNNLKDRRVTRNHSASPEAIDLVNRPAKHRRILLSPSDDEKNSDSNSSPDSHEVIDVNLYASLWEPRMVKDLVSIFHSYFSSLISLADQAGGTKS